MVLIENIDFLTERFYDVWTLIRENEEKLSKSNFQVHSSKTGAPTLSLVQQGRDLFLHSKYDPVQEAERLVNQYREVENFQHVFFYGVGLGYHVEAFMKKYPGMTFSMYEPVPAVFYNYLTQRSLKSLPARHLKDIYLETGPDQVYQILSHFVSVHSGKEVFLVVLPSYENAFPDQCVNFSKQFKTVVQDKRFSFESGVAFEKRWTLNSLINMIDVAKTPNVFHDIDRSHFKNKPAMLVAAGPSLQDDIESIRHIKENGLAYIFSVGSAIKVLLSNGIRPDAAVTYDPTQFNVLVYEEVIRQGIETIPLIYGSSVGFETIQQYKGPKLHMITNQDTVSPLFLKKEGANGLEIILDAPTIAVVAFQLLSRLGCSPIIFSGLNLAYRDNRYYAKGIEYQHWPSVLSDQMVKDAVMVEDVYGNMIPAGLDLDQMRKSLQSFIKILNHGELINTTKGGAKIEETIFMPLEELIEKRLGETVVNDDWFKCERDFYYDREHLSRQVEAIDDEHDELVSIIERIIKIFKELDFTVQSNNLPQIENIFPKFDKYYKKMLKNKFYSYFLKPMTRVQYDLLNKELAPIIKEKNQVFKARKVLRQFGNYVYICKQDFEFISPLYREITKGILAEQGLKVN